MRNDNMTTSLQNEHAGAAVSLQNYIRKVFVSILGRGTSQIGVFRGFPQSSQKEIPATSLQIFSRNSTNVLPTTICGVQLIGFTKFQAFQGSQIGLSETGNHWLERVLHIKICFNEELSNLREPTSEIGVFLILRFVFIIVYWFHTLYIRIIEANKMHYFSTLF